MRGTLGPWPRPQPRLRLLPCGGRARAPEGANQWGLGLPGPLRGRYERLLVKEPQVSLGARQPLGPLQVRAVAAPRGHGGRGHRGSP